MIAIRGGDVVLADRVVRGGTLHVEGATIAAVDEASALVAGSARTIDASGCLVLPGFVDVHVHGVGGLDVLAEGTPVAAMAEAMPRYGVTAFCPTSVACDPATLSRFLRAVSSARSRPAPGARVLPAHLESNFISPDFAGAQPLACLRRPPAASEAGPPGDPFLATHVLEVVAEQAGAVGIVTLAPELPGGLDLVRRLVAAGHIVSVGHTGADYDTTRAAIAAGARHATHLFNRMPPLGHRSPGAVGALLESADVAVELIADGVHVHHSLCRLAIAAKGRERVMAITDGTAGAGLPVGSRTSLGGLAIRVAEHVAELEDGTWAGSVATMNRVFAMLVTACGATPVDAAAMCATTPARQLGRSDLGTLTPGGAADIVVLDSAFDVRYTLVGGALAYSKVS